MYILWYVLPIKFLVLAPLTMTNTARLFTHGGSQAVRLPAEFRFDAQQVYVRRDARTGDVVLSTRPGTQWSEFMALRDSLGAASETNNFMAERPMNEADSRRDPFAGWKE